MKKLFIGLLARVLRGFLKDVLLIMLNWLLERLWAVLSQSWQRMTTQKRAEAARARQEREQAEAAGNHAGAQGAAVREEAAMRDAAFIETFGMAAGRAFRDVAAELPQAVELAVQEAARGSSTVIARLMNERSGQKLLGGPAAG